MKNNISQRKIYVQTELQAVASRATLHRIVSISSLYIPPHIKIDQDKLEEMTKQLSKRFILLRDFNSHSTIWGSKETNKKKNCRKIYYGYSTKNTGTHQSSNGKPVSNWTRQVWSDDLIRLYLKRGRWYMLYWSFPHHPGERWGDRWDWAPT